jgi:hypothetical protein
MLKGIKKLIPIINLRGETIKVLMRITMNHCKENRLSYQLMKMS